MGLKQLLIRLSAPQGTIDSGVEAQDLLISAGPSWDGVSHISSKVE